MLQVKSANGKVMYLFKSVFEKTVGIIYRCHDSRILCFKIRTSDMLVTNVFGVRHGVFSDKVTTKL